MIVCTGDPNGAGLNGEEPGLSALAMLPTNTIITVNIKTVAIRLNILVFTSYLLESFVAVQRIFQIELQSGNRQGKKSAPLASIVVYYRHLSTDALLS
jgi:hypothetical protein